jgi:hypothetical protein
MVYVITGTNLLWSEGSNISIIKKNLNVLNMGYDGGSNESFAMVMTLTTYSI